MGSPSLRDFHEVKKVKKNSCWMANNRKEKE
jgi:hypothetical protein